MALTDYGTRATWTYCRQTGEVSQKPAMQLEKCSELAIRCDVGDSVHYRSMLGLASGNRFLEAFVRDAGSASVGGETDEEDCPAWYPYLSWFSALED
jgi:hypothetical protein